MPAARNAPATAAPAEPARDSAQPIGTPPAGGRWTWDIAAQAWAPLPDTPAPAAAPTPTASKE